MLMVKAQLTMIFGLTNHKKFEYHKVILNYLFLFTISKVFACIPHLILIRYYTEEESYSMILSLKPKFCKSV